MGGIVRALVVDERLDEGRVLGDQLVAAGFLVSFARDRADAFGAILRKPPDIVVTRHHPPRSADLDLVRRIRAVSRVPVVMVTSFGSIPDCEAAFRAGVDRYLLLEAEGGHVGRAASELVRERARPEPDPRGGSGTGTTADRMRALARQELREELGRLLILCRGNIAEMARRMGRDRSTVRYHLRRFGMLEGSAGNTPRIG